MLNMAAVLPLLTVIVLSYLLGSISFSIIFTRQFSKTDIRSLGSGNAGTTNVLRSVGIKAGLFTLVFDFAKGAVAVGAGRAIFQYFSTLNGVPAYYTQYGAYVAGLFCVIGHIYPLYFGFRGGKGVLSSAAMLALIDWRFFAVCIGVFILVFAATKIVSLGSICGAISFPIVNLLFIGLIDYRSGALPLSYVWITTLFALSISALLVFKHRENIRRLKNGTEKKFTIRR